MTGNNEVGGLQHNQERILDEREGTTMIGSVGKAALDRIAFSLQALCSNKGHKLNPAPILLDMRPARV